MTWLPAILRTAGLDDSRRISLSGTGTAVPDGPVSVKPRTGTSSPGPRTKSGNPVLPLRIANTVARGVVDGCVGEFEPHAASAIPEAAIRDSKRGRIMPSTKQFEYPDEIWSKSRIFGPHYPASCRKSSAVTLRNRYVKMGSVQGHSSPFLYPGPPSMSFKRYRSSGCGANQPAATASPNIGYVIHAPSP
jgi:hypothetical protein